MDEMAIETMYRIGNTMLTRRLTRDRRTSDRKTIALAMAIETETEQEDLRDLDARDLAFDDLLEQEQHRDPQGRDLESDADPHVCEDPGAGR